jgi:hypothetical protein
MRACLATLVVVALAAPAVADDPRPRDPELAAGIALAKEGDFETALVKLEGAVRRLEAGEKHDPDLAVGYLYLGIAYLELDQELTARSRFRDAATADPALRLDPREFSPQVIRFFDSARQEVDAARAASTAPPAAASPPPEPKKKGRSALPFILLGGGAVAGIAVAASGGGSSSGTTPTNPTTTTTSTTTTTTTVPPASNRQPAPGHVAPPGATVSWSSVLDVPGASGQVVLDGLVAAFQSRGRARVDAVGRPGVGRIEAQLVSASGRPGTWTFEMGGAFEAGSLRVLAGDVAMVTADAIAFRIAGRAGERVVFTFRTKAP